MTAEQLQRHALSIGAELTFDGRVFNAARAKIAAPPKAPPPQPVFTEPPAAAPPPEMVSRDVVDSMLQEQAREFEQQLAALRSMVATGNPSAEREVLGFEPTLDDDGAIKFLRVVYAE